jgi:hypothetical protein
MTQEINNILVRGIRESKSSSRIVGWEVPRLRMGPGIVSGIAVTGSRKHPRIFVPRKLVECVVAEELQVHLKPL